MEDGSAAPFNDVAAVPSRDREAAEDDSGEALERVAEALYLDRQYAASAAHYERAYLAYLREARHGDAGRAAITVSWIKGNVLGDWAVRIGWLGRARSVLEVAGEDSQEHGWVLIIHAFLESGRRRFASRCSTTRSRSGGDSGTPTSSWTPRRTSAAS